MSEVTHSLLPPTSTNLAKALDVLEQRLFGLPVGAIGKDPSAVSEAQLDHLAWEYSVEVWGRDIPLETRRSIVSSSVDVHRWKGTKYGLSQAVASLGWGSEVIEWWQAQPEGERGTFVVKLSATLEFMVTADFMLEQQTEALLRQAVQRAAPVSRGFSVQFELPVDAAASPKIGAYTHGRIKSRTSAMERVQ